MDINRTYIFRLTRIKAVIALIFVFSSLVRTSAQNRSGKIEGWEITYKPLVELSKSDTVIGSEAGIKQLDSIPDLKKETEKLEVVLDVTSHYVRLLTKQHEQIIYL